MQSSLTIELNVQFISIYCNKYVLSDSQCKKSKWEKQMNTKQQNNIKLKRVNFIIQLNSALF